MSVGWVGERLEVLLGALPLLAGESVMEQGRHFLRVPVLMAIESPFCDPVVADPKICPNCDGPCDPKRLSPYCGERCKDMSSLVRQFRAVLPTDAILDPEKQITYAQIIWRLMGGGLPYRKSQIPDRAMVRFIEKNPTCAVCSAAATTADHLKTFCNRPINLRPVCDACTSTHPFGDPKVLAKGHGAMQDLAQRIRNEVAVRVCDDQATWDWRAFLKLRQAP